MCKDKDSYRATNSSPCPKNSRRDAPSGRLHETLEQTRSAASYTPYTTAETPPSMLIAVPVMKAAWSDTRKATSAPTSSG